MATGQFDIIIIGSGISGMTAGIILAKEGKRVLILEQHSIPGGLTQTFQRGGTVFPTGVHRLGALNPGEPLWYYFNYLGLIERLELTPMSREGFETYYFPDASFSVPQGHDAYKARLVSNFPEHADALENYFNDMARLVEGLDLYDPSKTVARDRSHLATGSLDDYFSGLGIQGKLKSILSANNPLFGLPSNQCPVLTHFTISDAYLKSSFRINENATRFSDALADSFHVAGGTIRTSAMATRLIIKNRTIQGVELAGGEFLKTDSVIFSGHPAMLPGLCPPKTFRPVYEKRLLAAENTSGLFGVSLIWEKNVCPVADNDAYIYGTWNVNAQYDRQSEAIGDEPDMIFLSALPGSPPGTMPSGDMPIAVTALAPLLPESQQRLMKTYRQTGGKAAYQEIKTELAENIISRINRVFPGAGKAARIADTYSPATFERYTLTPDGSAYGIKKTAQAFLQAMFSPATRVKGLYLTGQSIGFSGIHGGISASVNLCRGFFPDDYLMSKIRRQGRKQL